MIEDPNMVGYIAPRNSSFELKKALASHSAGTALLDTNALGPPISDLNPTHNDMRDRYYRIRGKNIFTALIHKDWRLITPYYVHLSCRDLQETISILQNTESIRTVGGVVRELEFLVDDLKEVYTILKDGYHNLPMKPEFRKSLMQELLNYQNHMLLARDELSERVLQPNAAVDSLAKFLWSLRRITIDEKEARKNSFRKYNRKKGLPSIRTDEELYATGLCSSVLDDNMCCIFTRDADILRLMQKSAAFFEKYTAPFAGAIEEEKFIVLHSGQHDFNLHSYLTIPYPKIPISRRKLSSRKPLLMKAYEAFEGEMRKKIHENAIARA